MMVPINYWAVIAAAVVNMVVGFLWYGPVFGKPWRREMGVAEGKMAGKSMGWTYFLLLVSSLVMSYVLAHALVFGNAYLMMSGAAAGLQGAFWYWLGFIAPVLLGAVLWENKSWKLWFINAGYYLVALMVMGAVLATWQ